MADSFNKGLPPLKKFFATVSPHVYHQTELREVLEENRSTWKLPQYLTSNKIIKKLVDEKIVEQLTLVSDEHGNQTRFRTGNVSDFLVALSLKAGSYLSHGSTVFLHGLNEQLPSTIYINKEQSNKATSDSPITQDGLDKAFANKQRESNYIYRYRDTRIVSLSGKHTDNLEVIEIKGPNNESLRATTVARTLIDIAVRPSYGGGIFQVIEAFKGAKGRVSVTSTLSVLKRLKYKYPYHQSIGFYLSQAGFPAEDLAKVKKLGLDFDFYLDYAIPKTNRVYVKEWRLFVPKGL